MSQTLTKQEIAFELQLLNKKYRETILELQSMLENANDSHIKPDFFDKADRLKIISGDIEKGQKMLTQFE